jgi:hypothetical protein
MNRTDIINSLIKKYNYKSYLEIGLDNPNHNYNLIDCELKECVDPYFEDDHKNGYDNKLDKKFMEETLKILTYRMTSDEFFNQNKKKYDIIFIDGLHTKEQVSRDIINSLKCLNLNGKIVVHDCLPGNETMQIVPRKQAGWCGDVWKAIPELKKQNIKYKVVDCDYGVGIIDYYRFHKNLQYINTFENEWKDFVNNRNELLNVISTNKFNELYNNK